VFWDGHGGDSARAVGGALFVEPVQAFEEAGGGFG
jgi:hypothetical protein